jgi:hypothetical protein
MRRKSSTRRGSGASSMSDEQPREEGPKRKAAVRPEESDSRMSAMVDVLSYSDGGRGEGAEDLH